MAFTRIVAACAILSLTVAGGLIAQDVRTEIGPLEKEAKPITPENPVPRRIYSIAPLYPPEAEAVDASSQVTLRITLDRGGRIAETRPTSTPLVLVPNRVNSSPAILRSIGDALIRSAVAAVQQWQYDAPADGPISFNIVFSFRPGAEPTVTQDSSPRPAPAAPAATRPPDNWPAAAGAVRVGGSVKPPVQVRRVNPLYPPEAQTARVQGVVILEAVIGADGRVADARVLRSIPLLDQAALDAVRQWEYQPSLMNGVPVPVVMTVTVQFTLS